MQQQGIQSNPQPIRGAAVAMKHYDMEGNLHLIIDSGAGPVEQVFSLTGMQRMFGGMKTVPSRR